MSSPKRLARIGYLPDTVGGFVVPDFSEVASAVVVMR